MTARPHGPWFPRPLPAERRGEAWWIEADGRELRLSNLDKVFWPREGYTKGDVIAHYFNIAERILPHLRDRPLTMKRMPEGIAGPYFYEKTAPSHTPDWVARCPVPSEDAREGVIGYLTANDLASLLYVANLGCIEMHPLHARCGSLEAPDYLFFDLDPIQASFEQVLRVALHVRAALDALGLASYPKTSGATGVQIFVPIERGYSYEQTRGFVGAIGRMIERADREHVTMAWQIERRTGKVFIDHTMNRSGANIAAVYSLRPEPGATVSTPLTWEEIEAGVRPTDFTIATIWERLERVGDLFEPVRTAPQDLGPALEALGLPADRAVAPPPRTSEEVIAASRDPALAEYVRKRTFGPGGTPEPAPQAEQRRRSERPSFVIHKHRATRLHYDLRLERDGALPSWAVPRGLPTRPSDRRLAVRTEDHPLEYASFEGTIPEGHYGAGEVRIFDDGWYEPLEWSDTKVTFRLHGRRYPGLEYHLVRTKTDWLIFLASRQAAPLIASPPSFAPMLAEGGWEPFDDEGWWFEPKLDGMRAIVRMATDETRVVSRTGRDVTPTYPELHQVHELVNQVNAVLDGEIVAFDEEGRNSFEALQRRMHLANEREIKRVAKQVPVALVVFDLLWLDGRATTELPLEQRRELLETIVEPDHRLQVIAHVQGAGIVFARSARELGLEGVVGKRLGSRYLPGKRSGDWRKIRLTNTQDCVILGLTPGRGGRAGSFGALLVGAYEDGRLRWVGQVGTGFTEAARERLIEALGPLERSEPAVEELREAKGATFVEPRLVCEVEYLEITGAGRMRAPSFKGLREDKVPEDCVLERPRRPGAEPAVRPRRAPRSRGR